MRSEISLHLKKRNVSRDKIHETHMSIYYKHICRVKWLLWWRRSNLYIIMLKKMKYPLSSTTIVKIRSFTYNLDHSLQILMPCKGISYTKLRHVYNWKQANITRIYTILVVFFYIQSKNNVLSNFILKCYMVCLANYKVFSLS